MKAKTRLYLVKELNLSQLNPCLGCLMVVTSLTKEDDVSKQLSTSTSQEAPFKRVLLITRSPGITGQSVVLRMLGPITQLMSLRFSEEFPAYRYQLDYAAQNMMPLIKSDRFEDFADTVSDEYR